MKRWFRDLARVKAFGWPHRRFWLLVCAGLLSIGSSTVIAATGGARATFLVNGPTAGFNARDLQRVDALVHQYMSRHEIPGLSFGITRHGRLVMTRSYGYADPQTGEQVTPRHRFRIASVSKPMTSIAIMKLVEQGRLRLRDRVFGSEALLGTQYGQQPYSAWVKRITVEHLLTHTAGGWPNDATDPMFSHPQWNQAQLITHTLDHVPLQFEPGTHYAYSNFGYCLLGRIIERVTGQSYERFVQSAILKPSGAHGMTLARNTLAERQPQEVVYMGGRWPYNIHVHRMDAHGGWLASPSDLLRVLVRVDRFDTVPDLLSDGVLQQMYTATNASNGGYAKGWSVNSVPNYWHNGAMPGTLALLVRTQGGFGWAAMTNARPSRDRFAKHLDRLMWDIRGAIQQWPSHNLF